MARRFAFLLVRDFTLSPLSLFIDTLRLAGDEGDRSRRIEFDWEIVGERGLPIRASCGVELLPTKGIGNPEDVAHAVVFLASPLARFITGAGLDIGGTIRGLV